MWPCASLRPSKPFAEPRVGETCKYYRRCLLHFRTKCMHTLPGMVTPEEFVRQRPPLPSAALPQRGRRCSSGELYTRATTCSRYGLYTRSTTRISLKGSTEPSFALRVLDSAHPEYDSLQKQFVSRWLHENTARRVSVVVEVCMYVATSSDGKGGLQNCCLISAKCALPWALKRPLRAKSIRTLQSLIKTSPFFFPVAILSGLISTFHDSLPKIFLQF